MSSYSKSVSVEEYLSARDSLLGEIIRLQPDCWSQTKTEDPIWGLMRIVVAQQISTRAASTLTRRVVNRYPGLETGDGMLEIEPTVLRDCGLSPRKAACCSEIANNSCIISAKVASGMPWEEAVRTIKGIGPWTIAIFRIMILKERDVLPSGDVGLERAIGIVYGPDRPLGELSENWRPFRSVACWYLWRSLGNPPLG
jgi:DNA-3-methyladenine glycosylase II